MLKVLACVMSILSLVSGPLVSMGESSRRPVRVLPFGQEVPFEVFSAEGPAGTLLCRRHPMQDIVINSEDGGEEAMRMALKQGLNLFASRFAEERFHMGVILMHDDPERPESIRAEMNRLIDEKARQLSAMVSSLNENVVGGAVWHRNGAQIVAEEESWVMYTLVGVIRMHRILAEAIQIEVTWFSVEKQSPVFNLELTPGGDEEVVDMFCQIEDSRPR